jgi:hypothetical protein
MKEKKINIVNPFDTTLQFLSNGQDSTETGKPNNRIEKARQKPVPIQNRPKTDKNGKEYKRKRYNLLLVPSVYEDIVKIADVEKISANEAINRAIKLYIKHKKDTLGKYFEIEKLKVSDKTESMNNA